MNGKEISIYNKEDNRILEGYAVYLLGGNKFFKSKMDRKIIRRKIGVLARMHLKMNNIFVFT